MSQVKVHASMDCLPSADRIEGIGDQKQSLVIDGPTRTSASRKPTDKPFRYRITRITMVMQFRVACHSAGDLDWCHPMMGLRLSACWPSFNASVSSAKAEVRWPVEIVSTGASVTWADDGAKLAQQRVWWECP